MSDKYNERVRAIAESMAKDRYPKHWDQLIGSSVDAAFWQQETESYINDFIPFTRLAVAHMAASYRKGCFSMRTLHQSATELKLLRKNIDKALKEEGLIPDNTQEGKPDPCPQELRCNTRNHQEATCDCHNMGILPQQEGGQNG